MAAVLLPVNVNPVGLGAGGGSTGKRQGFDQEVKILVKVRSAYIPH